MSLAWGQVFIASICISKTWPLLAGYHIVFPDIFQKNNNKSLLHCSDLLIFLKFLVLFLSFFRRRVKAKLCNTDLSFLLLTLVGTQLIFFLMFQKCSFIFVTPSLNLIHLSPLLPQQHLNRPAVNAVQWRHYPKTRKWFWLGDSPNIHIIMYNVIIMYRLLAWS